MEPPQEVRPLEAQKQEPKRSNSPIGLSSKSNMSLFRNKFQIQLGKLTSSDTKDIVPTYIGDY